MSSGTRSRFSPPRPRGRSVPPRRTIGATTRKHSRVFTVKTLHTSVIFLQRPSLFTSRSRSRRGGFSTAGGRGDGRVYKACLADTGRRLWPSERETATPAKHLPFQERQELWSLKSSTAVTPPAPPPPPHHHHIGLLTSPLDATALARVHACSLSYFGGLAIDPSRLAINSLP